MCAYAVTSTRPGRLTNALRSGGEPSVTQPPPAGLLLQAAAPMTRAGRPAGPHNNESE